MLLNYFWVWGPVDDIADGRVLDGIVVFSSWVGRGCFVFVVERGRMQLCIGFV